MLHLASITSLWEAQGVPRCSSCRCYFGEDMSHLVYSFPKFTSHLPTSTGQEHKQPRTAVTIQQGRYEFLLDGVWNEATGGLQPLLLCPLPTPWNAMSQGKPALSKGMTLSWITCISVWIKSDQVHFYTLDDGSELHQSHKQLGEASTPSGKWCPPRTLGLETVLQYRNRKRTSPSKKALLSAGACFVGKEIEVLGGCHSC